MKSMQPQIVKRVIVFVEWSIFLALLIGVGLFVQNVWFDYLSKATAIKEYTETHLELEVVILDSYNIVRMILNMLIHL